MQINLRTARGLEPTDLVARAAAQPDNWQALASFRPTGVGSADGVKALVSFDALTGFVEDTQKCARALSPGPERGAGPTGVIVTLHVRVHCKAAAMPRNARQVHPLGTPAGSDPVNDERKDDPTTGEALAAAVASRAVPADSRWSGLVPLGRFRNSEVGPLRPVDLNGHTYRPYISRRGRLVVAVDRPLKPFAAVYVDSLTLDDGRLTVTGTVRSRHSDLRHPRLVLIGRATGTRFEAPAHVELQEEVTRRDFGLRNSAVHASFDIAGLPVEQLLADDILDVWLEATTQDSDLVHRARIGNTPYLLRRSVEAGWRARGDQTVAITPYFTFKAKRVSLRVEVLDTDGFELLQKATRSRRSQPSRPQARPIWLVGERPTKAQDTGLAFFRFLREHHPEIDAYYVIDRSSPEVTNLAGLDHVVWHRSKEHIEVALRADRFIGSHHPDYLYPTWLPQFRKAVRGTKVFLQHGIMGTKWMVPNYGKHVTTFETDLFLVSSEREKEYIVSDFGYDPDDVVVTGLSRFDALFSNDMPVKRNQILVIPTWRDWLQDPATFEESDYLREWQEFLRDPRLRAVASAHHAEIVLSLHPNMQQFRSHFEDAGVRLIAPGDADVQDLIKQSAIMVTDYSSVGFDFAFLGKPVIYFQFDRERFLGRNGSHLDLDHELPGPIGFQATAVVDQVVEALESGGAMAAEFAKRADRFIAHRDQGNCERIFSAIRDARPRSSVDHLVDPELLALASNRFRRSRVYFPTMRRLSALWRRLPIDPNIIVFESGLGKQYADSPRYIYEELVRRRDPRKKVWVYQGKLPVTDRNTVSVKRLSPEYFWYLARAKYWVNNQNFPHYVRRRPDGVFIQTWHGTPLKRMQHDVAEIHGRDPGYLERVTSATRQWSVLLSPSPYATTAFRSAFRYGGPVLEVGYPRNDLLADPRRAATVRDRVRGRLGIGSSAKAILYAPTFRDDQVGSRSGRFRFEFPFELEDFAGALDDDVVLLVRMHVLVENDISIPTELRHRVIDVSAYPEIQDLYLASDVLVTDYSSVFFDYAILRRPIVFYAYDLERYRDQLRGFYLDYGEELPGPVVKDSQGLWTALRGALDATVDIERVTDFAAKYAPMDDGHAAGRVVDTWLRG
jgi:CDP-glycerol glycerophosphotransferase